MCFIGKLENIRVCSKCKKCWTIIVEKCRNESNNYVCLNCDPEKNDNLKKDKEDREIPQQGAEHIYRH